MAIFKKENNKEMFYSEKAQFFKDIGLDLIGN